MHKYSIIKKTPDEIQSEIYSIIDSLLLMSPRDLSVGDTFVISSEHYQRLFGNINTALWYVVNKSKTMIRYGTIGVSKGNSDTPKILTFKGALRDRVVLRRANATDIEMVIKLRVQLMNMDGARQARVKNDRDRYVLWNEASESILTGNLDRFSTSPERHGFVVEVFSGNGIVLDRIRMLSETEKVECALFDSTEKMVRAYASQYFDRDEIKRGAKFQIQHVPEMD